MHIFKTKDQSEKGGQLQGWHLNLTRMQLNRFLKSKLQLWTWLNKLKTENWFGNRHFLAPFLFKWNGTFCTNPVVSFTVHIKKSPKQCRFGTALCIFFFRWRVKIGKEGFSSFPLQHLSLSPPLICPKTLTPPTLPHDQPPWWKRQRGLASNSEVTAQRPPQPPYPCAMTGQG
jgi:hypothetical protein